MFLWDSKCWAQQGHRGSVMANTWQVLNSSTAGSRGEERRGSREERRWVESRDSPLWVSQTSLHFVLMRDKSHSEHKVPRWPNYAWPGQTRSCKLAQRDNVSLWPICAWMPTSWHRVNNNPFLLQTRIPFLVSLGTSRSFTVCRSPVCVRVCGLELSDLSVCSQDKGPHCSLAVHFTVTNKIRRWELRYRNIMLSNWNI